MRNNLLKILYHNIPKQHFWDIINCPKSFGYDDDDKHKFTYHEGFLMRNKYYTIYGDMYFRKHTNDIKSSILLKENEKKFCYFEIYENINNKNNHKLFYIPQQNFKNFDDLRKKYDFEDTSFLGEILPKYMVENNEQKIKISQIPKDLITLLKTKNDENLIYTEALGFYVSIGCM